MPFASMARIAATMPCTAARTSPVCPVSETVCMLRMGKPTDVVAASVHRLRGDAAAAEATLDGAVAVLRSADVARPAAALALAAALNNAALHAKRDGDPRGDAGALYAEALALREGALPRDHALVVQTLHNVAEYLDHRGDAADADAVRRDILDRLGVADADADAAFLDAAARRGAAPPERK